MTSEQNRTPRSIPGLPPLLPLGPLSDLEPCMRCGNETDLVFGVEGDASWHATSLVEFAGFDGDDAERFVAELYIEIGRAPDERVQRWYRICTSCTEETGFWPAFSTQQIRKSVETGDPIPYAVVETAQGER